MARILFLHGASSSGKSTLARAVRSASAEPFLHLSIDHLRDSGAWDPAAYPDWRSARPQFFSGFHRALAGFADAGNDLIVEHILDTPGWHAELQSLLSGHTLLFVGLHTPLEALCAGEEARGDRQPGSAASDYHSVHLGLCYDLSFDGTVDPALNAAEILRALNTSRPPSRFFTA